MEDVPVPCHSDLVVNSDNVIGFVSSPTQLFFFLASITVHLGVQNFMNEFMTDV